MKTNWPDGLSDREAIERLESLLITTVEGNRDLGTEKEYRLLRGVLISRDDLRDVVPQFMRSQRDLAAFAAFVRKVSGNRQARREHIWESFKPLLARLDGLSAAPIRSSAWTGKRTSSEQARIVLSLAPDALHGVELLLEEQETVLHNGGPVEPEQQDAITRLRELHRALGELIQLVQDERPIEPHLRLIRNLKDQTFKWTKETYHLTIAGVPLMTASTVMGCGVMMLINALTKGSIEAAATMGGGAMAVHAVAAHASRHKSSS